MLSPEDAEKVLTKNLANVIRKANSGKPLTAAERALLEQQAAGGTLTGSASAFAKTWDELAQRLGVSRKTLQNVSKRAQAGELPDLPKPRADGRHDVAAWSAFFVKHNIARSAEDLPPDQAAALGAPVTVTDWKAEKLKLECDRLTIENAQAAGELVLAADVEAGLSTMVAAFRQALNNLAARLATKAQGCTEYHELEEIAQEEVNVVLRSLQRADFLGAPAAVAIAPPITPAPDPVKAAPTDQRRDCAKIPQPKRNKPKASKPRTTKSRSVSGSVRKRPPPPQLDKTKVIAVNVGPVQPVKRRKPKTTEGGPSFAKAPEGRR